MRKFQGAHHLPTAFLQLDWNSCYLGMTSVDGWVSGPQRLRNLLKVAHLVSNLSTGDQPS